MVKWWRRGTDEDRRFAKQLIVLIVALLAFSIWAESGPEPEPYYGQPDFEYCAPRSC